MSTPLQKPERKLVAIFAADVAGYSRLMGVDEVETLRTLTTYREVMDRLIAEYRGRIANTAGDSVLAEFASVVDAVQCAVEVQKVITQANEVLQPDRRVQFRIGVHVGDVMVRSGDLFGDGVNVAARLQEIAEPGGICTSGTAHDYVRKALSLAYTDLGPQQVKNIEEPVRAFAIGPGIAAPAIHSRKPEEPQLLPLPERPSIAVLPFTNMSGDPEQEYFADGVVEDIITSLARFPRLFVIARNSSFTYKGRPVNLTQVGRELGVRYILEGSIRKAGNRVRITGQLIEAQTDSHLWADRFDGDLTDIFALQDEITERVVGVIEPRIRQAEIEAAIRKRPDNLTSYDLYLRALPLFHSMTRAGSDEALRLLFRALELDPRYGAAASLASTALGHRVAQGWATNPAEEMDEAIRLTRLALDIDPNDPDALSIAGRNLAYAGRDFEAGVELVDRATQVCPNSAFAWSQRGWTYAYAARPSEAVEFLQRAIRLSPMDSTLYATLAGLALAYLQLEQYRDAADAARKSAQQNPYFSSSLRMLAAALAHLGLLNEAQEAAQHMLRVEPNFTISVWEARSRWKYPARENFAAGMRKAGLPE